jgi:hypothetical protein
MAGIDREDLEASLQDVPARLPEYSGRFHGGVGTPAADRACRSAVSVLNVRTWGRRGRLGHFAKAAAAHVVYEAPNLFTVRNDGAASVGGFASPSRLRL